MVRLTRTSIEFHIFGTWIRYHGRTSSWPVFLHDTVLGALGYLKLCLTVKHYFHRQGKKLSNEQLRVLVEGLMIEHKRRDALKGGQPPTIYDTSGDSFQIRRRLLPRPTD
jgi:hypothetical protein